MVPILIVVVWIFILALCVLTATTQCPNEKKMTGDDKKEGFSVHDMYYKRYCGGCGRRSRLGCSKCTNCGFCVTSDGRGSCVSGDAHGPYFREDCAIWEYGEPYQMAQHRIRPFHPIRRHNIYPYFNWSLRRPYNWLRSFY